MIYNRFHGFSLVSGIFYKRTTKVRQIKNPYKITMATTKKTKTTNSSPNYPLGYIPRNYGKGGSPQRDYPEVLERPGECLGKLIARQCVDGVTGLNSPLLRGQFDDHFGEVDPCSDIHSDKHLLADALMRRDIAASKVTPIGDDGGLAAPVEKE